MGYIYQIRNIKNNKLYIGKTERPLAERFEEHLRHARNHENRRLYDAMNKYGYDCFVIEPIEQVSNAELAEREIYYIALFKTMDKQFGYNMTPGGDGVVSMTPEALQRHNEKISKALAGRTQPKELVEKRAAKLRGQKRTPEARAKMSKARLGKTPWNKGKHCSQATIQKLRVANTGKHQTEETREKRKQAMKKLKWWNNGSINIRAELCPPGFVAGRLKNKDE